MNNAKYTVVLKTLLDDEYTKGKIEQALSTYPLYEPPKHYDMIPNRSELNKKILNHYKYREIGFETVGRFLDELEITMHEIMPQYNELLKTVEIMGELPSPFDNVDVIEKYTETRQGESKNNIVANDTSTSNSDSKDVKSTTPQNEMDIPAKNIDNISYADEVNWSKNNGDSTSNSETDSTLTNTENIEHTYTKTGNQGVNTYAHDMNEFRTSIIDIVDMIINDTRLNNLFMLVY